MTSWEPDRDMFIVREAVDTIDGHDWYAEQLQTIQRGGAEPARFSRGTYWGVGFFIACALGIAALLYMGRPW